MEHGGRRFNAGRKKGSFSKNKIALDDIKKEIESGDQLAPVQVMIYIMNASLESGRHDVALDAAAKAAPYLHAKLIESKNENTLVKKIPDMTDEELRMILGNDASSCNTE